MAAHLRRCNITIFPYLDNWLIHGRAHQQTSEAVHNMLNFFQRLGLKVNKLKSILTSIQRIKFIFQILDSSASRLCLPQDRFENLSTIDLQLERNPHTYIQLCLTILGHITSCTFVIPYARLHLHCLWSGLKLFYTCSKHHQDMPLIIPPLILSILKWWKNTMNACRGVPFWVPLPSKIIITDSSLLGWGTRTYICIDCIYIHVQVMCASLCLNHSIVEERELCKLMQEPGSYCWWVHTVSMWPMSSNWPQPQTRESQRSHL